MQTLTTNNKKTLTLLNENYHLRKYKILEIIDSLPANKSKLFKSQIPIKLEVNRQTWSNWLNAKITDKLEIPSIKLSLIAHFLGVEIKDLINIPINPDPIESEQTKQLKNIMKLTKLVKE